MKWRSEKIDVYDTVVIKRFCGDVAAGEVRLLAFGFAFLTADMRS